MFLKLVTLTLLSSALFVPDIEVQVPLAVGGGGAGQDGGGGQLQEDVTFVRPESKLKLK